ncbi:ATPase family associated with various cellular activities (AAA) domain-containing protein [Sarocladium implicatum]|nr:ATPase family associated with various cellular activities (AAA) domain-containing protein [Sarocladium implicatum]
MDIVEILSNSLGGPALDSHNATGPSAPNATSSSTPSPQFALIDFFIPGFSGFSNVVRHHFGLDISLYIPILAFIFGFSFVWDRLSNYLWQLIEEYLVSSVRIRTDDEIYNILIAWVAKQGFSRRSRKIIANTNLSSRDYYSYSYDSDDSSDDEDACFDPEDGGFGKTREKSKPLHYTPAGGSNYFFYGHNLMLFQRDQAKERPGWGSNNSHHKEELVISSLGRSPNALKKLLNEARLDYLKKDENKTVIYRGSAGSFGGDPQWQRCMSRSARPLSTVILNEQVKKDLIADVADYLNPATRRWYANRGIPYRRGYLLHGPPGTGKSSLSLALAGHFRMRIYIVSLSSVVATEESLASLFIDLPRRCVVLLEDIDSAGLTHTRDDNDSPAAAAVAPTPLVAVSEDGNGGDEGAEGLIAPSSATGGGGRLSLSGLLNILDGVASQEGRVLVMTTNHVEKLDKALVRPGRVDRIVHFGLADATMAASVFRAIYALYDGEADPSCKPSRLSAVEVNPDVVAKRKVKEEMEREKKRERIEELALEFGEKLPALEFSPAEIQGLLLRHKLDPEGAIAALPEWVEKTRQDKREKEVEEAEKRRKEEEAAAAKKAQEKEKSKAEEETTGEKSENDDEDKKESQDGETKDEVKKEKKKKKKKKQRKVDEKEANHETEEDS